MKSKNKGFTLVELLAVLVLLGLLTGMVLFQASKTLTKANRQDYKTQERMIVLSAKDYFMDYRSQLPKEIGQTTEVLLSTLEDENYIDLVLDVNQKPCNGLESKVIVKKKNEKEYSYQAYLSCTQANYHTEIE